MVTTEETNKICDFLDNLNALTDAEMHQTIRNIKMVVSRTPNTTFVLNIDNPSKLVKIDFEKGILKEVSEVYSER